MGAGPAGITVARRLGAMGARVLLIESGGLTPDEATQSLAEGEVTGEQYWALHTSRLRFFGGTSNHWTGYCRPLDPLDFEPRSWVDVPGWPLTYDELAPYYERAHEVCELGPFEYSPAFWSERAKAELLPLDPQRVTSAIWQFSPPTRFGERYRPDIDGSSKITASLNLNAVHVQLETNGSQVDSLLLRRLDGAELHARAKVFVLAMGGLETTRILLASDDVHRSGIGNAQGLLGRYFLEHPHAPVGVLLCRPNVDQLRLYYGVTEVDVGRRAGVQASLALTPEVQRRDGLLNFNLGMQPLARKAPYAPLQAAGATALVRDLEGIDAAHPFELFARAEQWPTAESHVYLTAKRDALGVRRLALKWRHDPRTRESMRKSLELIALAMGRAGIGRVYSYIHSRERVPGAWPELSGGHHHMGTTRMHPDPRFGVVDAQCRVHGTNNLFVASSSVFPTGGYANPTLTIVALSLRLADELGRRLR